MGRMNFPENAILVKQYQMVSLTFETKWFFYFKKVSKVFPALVGGSQ